MKLHPLGDRLVAKPIEAQSKTAAGILLPEQAKEKAIVAEVISVGSDVTTVKVGDKILYSGKYDSSKEEVKIEGEELLLLKAEDVLAIVK